MDNNVKLALELISKDSDTRPIADLLVTLPIVTEPTDSPTSFAEYDFHTNKVIINPRTNASTEAMAATLVHEGQHALDMKNGVLCTEHPFKSDAAFKARIEDEVRAAETESAFWSRLYPNGRDDADTDMDRVENDKLRAYKGGTLDEEVRQIYTWQYTLSALQQLAHI